MHRRARTSRSASGGSMPPRRLWAATELDAARGAGQEPEAKTQQAARSPIGATSSRRSHPAGRPSRYALRGLPRNTAPNTLTKQATARAPISARAGAPSAAARGRSVARRRRVSESCRDRSSSSLTKPLRGGSPQIATAPTRKASAGPRHPAEEARRARRCRACRSRESPSRRKKEERLEQAVVPHVQEAPPAKPSATRRVGAGRAEHRRRRARCRMMPMFSTLW